ncbi:TonB-dependent receptor [Gracilimonas sp.]|uniref:TonB-dependent receptor domain-containing protein n=1 Tax=Gracilimonas sp. TaxID=1974203 RepID=UPI0032EF8BA9
MLKKLQLALFASLLSASLYAQSGTITGMVTDAGTSEPLIGVNVILQGTTYGDATDLDGIYEISGVPAGTYTLRANFIGFKPFETQVEVGSGTVNLDIELNEDVLGLEDLVVTGIASRSSKAISEVAISRVDAAELTADKAYNSVSQLLTAKVAGVSVQPASGTVGGGIRFVVRSGGGLNGQGQPVIYVDGVRIDNVQTGFGAGGQNYGTLSDLNPENIESIDFLKGPAAAALYGTSGSNGVVLITTKTGQTASAGSSVSVNYKGSIGVNSLANEYDDDVFISAEDANDAFRDGQVQSHNVSVSGGNEFVRYFTSFGTRNEEGTLPQNAQERQSVQANFDAFPSDKVTFSVNTSYALNTVNIPQNDNNVTGWLGNTLLFPTSYGFTDSLAIANVENESKTNRFIGSFQFNYRPIDGLNINLAAGIDDSDLRAFTYQSPEYAYSGIGFQGSKNIFNRQNQQVTLDANASYAFDITDDISSNTVIGTQLFNRKFRTSQLGRQNFATSLVRDIQSASQINVTSEGFGHVRSAGIFAQEEINYQQTYFLTIGGRQDFASAFGTDTPNIFYPKASAAVRIDKLGILPDAIDFLKVRAAYGETGQLPGNNDGIRLIWGATPSGFGTGGVPASIGNPSIKPERVKELELGFEASIFENYGIDFTYYIQNAENSIIGLLNSPSTGLVASSSPFNIGALEGSGIEVAINATPILSRDYQLDISAILSYSENEVTDIGDAQPIRDGFDLNTIQPGLPRSAFYTFEVQGANFDNNGFYTGPDVAFTEENRVALGTPYPEYQGSFSVDFRFLKNFNVFALVEYQLGLSVFNNTLLFANSFGNGAEYETLQGLLAGTPGVGSSYYNTNANPDDDITALTPGSQEYIDAANRYAELTTGADYGYVEEADFVRLREVSVRYDFTDVLNSANLTQYVKNASISVSGSNLWLSSKYSGNDPEVNFAGARSNSRGQDFLTLPQPRSVFATLNIGF